MDDRALARRCAEGDMKAFEELYVKYSPRIYALCLRYAGGPAEAEDLMQDSFIKIFRSIKKYRHTEGTPLSHWLTRVALNCCFDSYRKRKPFRTVSIEETGIQEARQEEPGYEQTLAVPQEALLKLIDELPYKYRTIFQLFHMDGLSHKEIAKLLGIKENTSSSDLVRARALLAAGINNYIKAHCDE